MIRCQFVTHALTFQSSSYCPFYAESTYFLTAVNYLARRKRDAIGTSQSHWNQRLPFPSCLQLALPMFSAATPVKKAHTRASAAVRRSQSRAASVLSQQRALTPPQPADGPTRRIVANVGGQLAETAVTADNDISLDTLESQGVFLKTETHTVSLYGAGLPGDVMQILSESGVFERCQIEMQCEETQLAKRGLHPRLLPQPLYGRP